MGETRFLTMEIVDGRTIDALVPKTGLALPELLKYAIPLVDALAVAHGRHIVHRDLKPSNVMVTRDGRVKVLDFGLAKLEPTAVLDPRTRTTTAAPVSAVGQIIGTVAHMSPEQAEGRPVDHRSDIFSLGILLYEMATGLRPFKGDTNISVLSSILKDAPTPITQLRSGVSRDLERIIERCLAKDRSDGCSQRRTCAMSWTCSSLRRARAQRDECRRARGLQLPECFSRSERRICS